MDDPADCFFMFFWIFLFLFCSDLVLFLEMGLEKLRKKNVVLFLHLSQKKVIYLFIFIVLFFGVCICGK